MTKVKTESAIYRYYFRSFLKASEKFQSWLGDGHSAYLWYSHHRLKFTGKLEKVPIGMAFSCLELEFFCPLYASERFTLLEHANNINVNFKNYSQVEQFEFLTTNNFILRKTAKFLQDLVTKRQKSTRN